MLRKTRPLNVLIIFILLLQAAVYPANALGNDTASPSVKPAITVDQAVKIVKDNFTIPEKYSQMYTGYNEFNNRATYSLNWNTPNGPGGSFNAQVDAVTGEIVNVNQWDYPLKPVFSLPVISSDEAEKTAAALIAKLAAKHQAEMQLIKNDQQVFAINGYQPFMYNFHWVRIVNGIQFPDNGVNVGVSGDGKIFNYNLNWTPDLVFPDSAKVVSPEQARQAFTDAPMVKLQYYLTPIMNPQDPAPQRVLLVYSLNNEYLGGAIDALTGQPVTLDPKVGIYKNMAFQSTVPLSMPAETSSSVVNPTKEDASVSNPKISRDEAAEIVKKLIDIPSDLVLHNSNLNPDWQSGDQAWNLNWDNQPTMGSYRSVSATVDATTGDFIGFNLSTSSDSGDKSTPLTRDAAQKLADDFIKRVQPDRSKLVQPDNGNMYVGMPGNIQMFNYSRYVNGIPVANNAMNVTVDTVNKQVIGYNMSWSKLEFPSIPEVLPLNQAIDLFLKQRPLVLNYSLITQQDGKQEVRLVYQPDIVNNMNYSMMIDAKTGDSLDWSGNVQSQLDKAHNFTDVQGNYAEKEIGIMGLTGAFGEYGDSFHPDENVTVGSLLRAMLIAQGNSRDRVLTDKDVLKLAKEQGWITEDVKLDSELSRTDLSKIIIRLVNMETSAKINGIYQVPFADAGSIQPDSLGYVALAWGLGILKADGDNLQPNQNATRADAAYALVHAYAVEQPKNPRY